MSTAVATTEAAPPIKIDDIEALVVQGDLSKLNAEQRVRYVKKLATDLGLNMLARPFDYITLQGKLVLYANKGCAEQLRQNRKVSITSLTGKEEGGVYVVTVIGSLPEGRSDAATGAVAIDGLKGEFRANAIMKAETKAKRRLTLSLCSLNMPDESEIESEIAKKPAEKDVTAESSVAPASKAKKEEKPKAPEPQAPAAPSTQTASPASPPTSAPQTASAAASQPAMQPPQQASTPPAQPPRQTPATAAPAAISPEVLPPEQAGPSSLGATDPGIYIPKVGKFAGKQLRMANDAELGKYVSQMMQAMAAPNAPDWTKRPEAQEFIKMAEAYLNRPKNEAGSFEDFKPEPIAAPASQAPAAPGVITENLGDFRFTFGKHTDKRLREMPLEGEDDLRVYFTKLQAAPDESPYREARIAVEKYLASLSPKMPAGL